MTEIVAVVICDSCGNRRLGTFRREDGKLWWAAADSKTTGRGSEDAPRWAVGDTAESVEARMHGRSHRDAPPAVAVLAQARFSAWCRQCHRSGWVGVAADVLDPLRAHRGPGPLEVRVNPRAAS